MRNITHTHALSHKNTGNKQLNTMPFNKLAKVIIETKLMLCVITLCSYILQILPHKCLLMLTFKTMLLNIMFNDIM